MSFKIENWKLLILSAFYVAFAIISYMISEEQFLDFFMIAGIVLAFVGVCQILIYFFKKEYMKPNEYSFAFGILYCIAGLIVATKPNVIVDNYPVVLSGVMVLDSTLRLQYSMNLFRLEKSQWKVHAILAAIPLIMAMVLILVPFEETFMHNYFSFLLILDAIANFYTILYYKKITKDFERTGYAIASNTPLDNTKDSVEPSTKENTKENTEEVVETIVEENPVEVVEENPVEVVEESTNKTTE